jgi:prevent-host-death family protein
MKTVSIYEARNRLSQLIKDASSGEEIIISNRGEPVAKITGIPRQSLPPGNPVRIAEWLAQNPFPAHARRSPEEIERAIEDERNSWD